MNAISKAKITHESETQRQYPRFSLPSRALLNGKEYEVKNLSTGGIALSHVEGSFPRGKQVSAELKFPFNALSLGMTLSAEVQYYNAAEKILGCRFINQGPEQISFLSHIIKSFIAGDIVTSENILNVAQRNNFTKPRPYANGNVSAPSFWRQLPGLSLVLMIGVLIITLIGSSLYNSMFVVKADDAVVMGSSVAVRAMADGVFRSRLDPGLSLVQQNQVIGTVTQAGSGIVTSIQSPCNCYIAKTYLSTGEVVSSGQQVMALTPINAKPWILSEIDPSQAKKIKSDSVATISIFNSRMNYTGHVVSMESPLSEGHAGNGKSVLMKIVLDQKLPIDFVNRLAAVTFAIY